MRSARPVTVGLATGLFVITSGVTGTALATTSPPATVSASASGTVSSAAIKATVKATSSATATASSPAATPRATGTGPTGGAISATIPAASPTPTPTRTPSASTSATPTPKPVADIVVTASATSVRPGATILFRISAYTNLSASATGKITSTLTPSAKTPAFSAPAYTVGCTSAVGTTCDLSVPGARPPAPQVEAQVTVPKTATAGETVKYRATVTVTSGGDTFNAAANAPTITVAKTPAMPSATPSSTKSAAAGSPSAGTTGGSTANIPSLSGTTDNAGAAIPLGALPAVAGVSTTIPAGNASSLFPQISPSASPSPAPGTAAASPAKAQPVADSSRIPLSLSSSEFGAQIVGLIVLLLGVAIAVTRLSLRKTRPTSNK